MAAAPTIRTEAEGARPVPYRGHAPRVQCAPLQVSSPHDAAEAEARSAARQVMRQPAPPLLQREALSLARSPRAVQREGGAAPAVSPDTAARLQAGAGGGQPLSVPLRRFMEPRFNADFSAVRLHTDAEAAALARRLNARAFTHGGDVYFGRGEYRPDSAEGRELIAHELAHTIQQGAAPRSTVQRSESPALTPQPRGLLHRLGLSDILDGLAQLAANLPGFTLLTLVIGRNPINQRAVERSPVNILRAFMGLIPGGEALFQVLQRQGVVDRIGAWIGDQVAALGLGFQTVRDAFVRFTDSLSWTDIFSPGDVWRRAEAVFRPIVDRVARLAGGLVTQAVTWLKETFLGPLAEFCRQIPGYGLVTVMLGRDPFTNEPVPRSALNVVRAFAEFIPGGTEKVDQLVQSGALERAHAWFQQETTSRNLTWARVAGTFQSAWASLRLEDVLAPVATVQRIGRQFSSLFGDLVSFAGAALMKLLELIYEAAMGAGGRRILEILMRARATFLIVIRNPVGFLRNLLGAVGQGVRQFMGNILAHLREGVIGWLTGAIARSGLQMPERWDLRGIIFFVLQILGLTWARVREKLVRLLGERVVAGLEAGFQLLQEIRERGLVAALRDRVSEFFGSLRDAALGSIRSFIQERIVVAGITQLLSMLIPVAAILQAIQKTYTTIQFFIQRIQQILDLVESIVNSIAAIASGAIGAAANLVERTMARTLPVILDFLARFIGLGDVGAQVQRTIRQLQGAVDRMLDRAVEWVRGQATRLGAAVVRGASAILRLPVRVGRQQHHLTTAIVGGRQRLMIESTPTVLRTWLVEWQAELRRRFNDRGGLPESVQEAFARLQSTVDTAPLQPNGEFSRATLSTIVTAIGNIAVRVGEDAEARRLLAELSSRNQMPMVQRALQDMTSSSALAAALMQRVRTIQAVSATGNASLADVEILREYQGVAGLGLGVYLDGDQRVRKVAAFNDVLIRVSAQNAQRGQEAVLAHYNRMHRLVVRDGFEVISDPPAIVGVVDLPRQVIPRVQRHQEDMIRARIAGSVVLRQGISAVVAVQQNTICGRCVVRLSQPEGMNLEQAYAEGGNRTEVAIVSPLSPGDMRQLLTLGGQLSEALRRVISS